MNIEIPSAKKMNSMTTRNNSRAFALGVLFSLALAPAFVRMVNGESTPTPTPKTKRAAVSASASPGPSESPSATPSETSPPSVSRFFDPQTGNYWRYDNGQWWSYSYSAENAIRALELAGWSAERRSHYGDALQHLRAAEKLTNRQRNPKEWARIQNAIANLLLQQGHYPEAENIWRQVIETRVVELGPEDPDTLRSRTALAATMDAQGKSAEAEAEHREIVGMD